MMRWIAVLIISTSAAMDSRASEMTALYDGDAMVLGMTIPLSVTRLKNQPGARLLSLQFEDPATAENCRIAQSPHQNHIVLLRCQEPTTLAIQMEILAGGSLFKISHGPIQIRELRPGFREPESENPNPPIDPEVEEGRILFLTGTSPKVGGTPQSCRECHTTPTSFGKDLRGASASTLIGAFDSVQSMKHLNRLTQTQAEKVSKYLKTIRQTGEWR